VLELAAIRADRDGVVTYIQSQEGAALRTGDVVARIADLSTYRIDATVSDVHAARLVSGLPALVRLASGSLQGTLAAVDPEVRNGVITVSVRLATPNAPALRPNLRADVELVIAQRDGVVRVSRGPFASGAATEQVFVVRGDRAVRQAVRFGVAGFDAFEVVDGQPQRKVVISDMRLRGSDDDDSTIQAAPAPSPVRRQRRAAAGAARRRSWPQRRKDYRTDRIETVALSQISLDVHAGEFVAVMGPSGCGKSTLLNIVGLLDTPSRGRVTINGTPVTDASDRVLARLRNREVGFVFQTFHLVPDLRVIDNVEIPLLYRSMPGADRRQAARDALERVGPLACHFSSQLPEAAAARRDRRPSLLPPMSRPATSTRRWATRSWASARSAATRRDDIVMVTASGR
jgi:ABC-type multidrug transport system fused ATPase/permease subunit